MTAETKGRFYLIRARADKAPLALVRSTTQNGALAHYVADSLTVSLPTQDELLSPDVNALRRLDALAYKREG